MFLFCLRGNLNGSLQLVIIRSEVTPRVKFWARIFLSTMRFFN